MATGQRARSESPLIEDLLDAPTNNVPSKKRKRTAVKTTTTNPDHDDDIPIPIKQRNKRARKAQNPSTAIDETHLDADLGVNHAIAHMDPSLLADHLAQRIRRFEPGLTAVEVDDLCLSAAAIRDATGYEIERKSKNKIKVRTTENLVDFLSWCAGAEDESGAGKGSGKGGKSGGKASKGLAWAPKEKGSPHTLIIAGAGLRAADLTRGLRVYQTKESLVAKLFAKHIKLKEAVEMVKSTRMGIGVGTPQRLIDLIGGEVEQQDGVLKVDKLERIIVDASHIDQKKRGLLDMKETVLPLLKLLSRKELKERYGTGRGKIGLLFY